MYGAWKLFGSFIPTIFGRMQTMPVIGPFIRNQPWLHQLVEKTQATSKQQTSFSGAPTPAESKSYDV